jgi:hypothetical protein
MAAAVSRELCHIGRLAPSGSPFDHNPQHRAGYSGDS